MNLPEVQTIFRDREGHFIAPADFGRMLSDHSRYRVEVRAHGSGRLLKTEDCASKKYVARMAQGIWLAAKFGRKQAIGRVFDVGGNYRYGSFEASIQSN